MSKNLIVKKKYFSTYFNNTRKQIVEIANDSLAVEEQEHIKNDLLFELQKLYVERTFNPKSIIYLYDLVGAFLGCPDVVVEE